MSQEMPYANEDRDPFKYRNLWKKRMLENANRESVQEEVDSLSDGGRYNVTISFENMTPEVVSWLMGNMNSYIHMARFVDIEPVKETRKGLHHTFEAYDETNAVSED